MSDNSDFLDAALSVIPSSENAPANPNKAFLDAAISSLPEPEVDPNAPGMAETAGRTVLNEVGPSTAALAAATATAPLGAVSFGVIPALAAVAAYGVSKYSIRKGREFLIDKGPADEIAARELAGQQANPGTAQIAGMVGQVPLMLTGPAALAGKATLGRAVAQNAITGGVMGGAQVAGQMAEGNPDATLGAMAAEMVKGGVVFSPLSFIPAARSVLGAAGWKAPTDAVALALTTAVYDHAVSGKEFDLNEIAKEGRGSIPAFVLMNLATSLGRMPLRPSKNNPPAHAGSVQDAIAKEKARREAVSQLSTGEGVAQWAAANPDAAHGLALLEAPSRTQFEKAGLPRVSADERARIAATVKGLGWGEAKKPNMALAEADVNLQRMNEWADRTPVPETPSGAATVAAGPTAEKASSPVVQDAGAGVAPVPVVKNKGKKVTPAEPVAEPVKPPTVEGLKYNGVQKIDGQPDQHVFTEEKTQSTFYSTDISPEHLASERDRIRKPFEKPEPEPAPPPAAVPLMITKKMEADLLARGMKQAEIDNLTPEQANDILSKPADELFVPPFNLAGQKVEAVTESAADVAGKTRKAAKDKEAAQGNLFDQKQKAKPKKGMPQKDAPKEEQVAWFVDAGMSPEAAQKAYEGRQGELKTDDNGVRPKLPVEPAKVEAPPAPAAKKKGKRGGVQEVNVERNPIGAIVQAAGGIRPYKPTIGKNGKKIPHLPEHYAGVPLIYRGKGEAPDQMLKQVRETHPEIETVDQMIEALKGKKVESPETAHYDQLASQELQSQKGTPKTVAGGTMKPGDLFFGSVDESKPPEWHKVISRNVSKNGEIDSTVLQDGVRVEVDGLQDLSGVHLKRGASVKERDPLYDIAMQEYHIQERDAGKVKIEGMGAAAADSGRDFQPSGGTVPAGDMSGLRESVKRIERRALGLPEAVRDEPRTFETLVDDAKAKRAEDPGYAQRLIDDIKGDGRPLEDYEVATLSLENNIRWEERNAAAAETSRVANGTAAEKAAAEARLKIAEDKLEELFEVTAVGVGQSKTAMGRGLSALRLMLDEFMNPVRMAQKLREIKKRPLTREELNELEELAKRHKETADKLQVEKERLEKELAKRDVENSQLKFEADWGRMVTEAITEPQKKKFSKRVLDLADQMDAAADAAEASAIAGFKARPGKAMAGVDPMVLADISKYGAAVTIRGATMLMRMSVKAGSSLAERAKNFPEWAKKMRERFAQLTDKDLQDIFKAAVKMIDIEGAKAPVGEKKEGGGEKPANGDMPTIKELFRMQADAGVRDSNEALKNVHEIVNEQYKEMSVEEVRDEYSQWGKARPMNRTDAQKVMADWRRQYQLIASIEHVKYTHEAPPKSGLQPDKPSAIQRELGRDLRSVMRELGISPVDPTTQMASALSAAKTRFENSIVDLEKAIADHKEMKKSSRTVEYDQEAKDLQARRDALRAKYDEMFPKAPMSDEQRLGIAIKAAERSLEDWNTRLKDAKSGKFRGKKEPKPLPLSERLDSIRAERDAAKAEVEALKEIAFPKRTPEQIAVDNKRKALERSMKAMQKQIDTNNFTPREKKDIDISGDPAAMKAMADHALVLQERNRLMEKARWESISKEQKAWELFKAGWNAIRAVVFSGDVSALERQGGIFNLTHPKEWSKAVVPAFKSFSQENSAVYAQQFVESPNFRNGIYKKMKLAYTTGDGTGNFPSADDIVRLSITRVVPGLGKLVDASGRSFVTTTNIHRTAFADLLLANTETGRKIMANPKNLTPRDIQFLEDIGWGVNALTLRSTLPGADAAAWVLGAPRFTKAVFDIVLFRPISRAKTWEAKIAFAKEYARLIGVVVAMGGIYSYFSDDELELNPTSSKFMDMKLFNKYDFNPLGALKQKIIFLARSLSGKQKIDDEIIDIIDWNGWFTTPDKKSTVPNGKGWVEVATKFTRSMIHPSIEGLIEWHTGTDYNGRMKARLAVAAGSLFPLSIPQVYEAYKTTDPITATAVSAGNIVGGTFKPDYSDPAVKAKEIKTDLDMRKQIYAATTQAASAASFKTSIQRNIRKGVDDPQAKTLADRERKQADTLKEVAVLMEISPDKLSYEKAVELLKAEALSRGETTALSDKSGKKTSFAKRVDALKRIISERDAKKAQ